MKTNIKTNIKSARKWIVVISSVFVLLNCSQIAIAADITAQRMIKLTNESREKLGLLPLKINDKLTVAAEAKINDMFEFQYFDHNSPSGVTPWYWIKSAGYDYLYAGENLAIDFVTAEGSHLALMRSITHRDNILKPNYTEIGVAVRGGIFEGNESIIIVEQFGAPSKKENRESKVVVSESKREIKIEEPHKIEVNHLANIIYRGMTLQFNVKRIRFLDNIVITIDYNNFDSIPLKDNVIEELKNEVLSQFKDKDNNG